MQNVLLLLVLSCVLLSCGISNTYSQNPIIPLDKPIPGGVVYLQNPELREETEILKASGIFKLTSEPEGVQVLILHELKREYVEGSPFMLTFITFGLFPAWIPDNSVFSFTLKNVSGSNKYQYQILATTRISPVEYFFRPFRDKTETYGNILATEYSKGLNKGSTNE